MTNQCEWKQDGAWIECQDDWFTECQHGFTFTEGGPAENEFKFCCYCSKPIKAVPWVPEPDEDERED